MTSIAEEKSYAGRLLNKGHPSGSAKVSPASTTTYSVSCGSAPIASVTVTVNAASLSSLAISGQQSLTWGQNAQLTVTGTYSDGSQQNLTNSVAYQNPSNFGTITRAGLYTAPQQNGSTTITASLGNITSPGFTITVTQPTLALTSVTPGNLYSDAPFTYEWFLTGTGFAAGDILQTFVGPITLPQGVSPTQLTVEIDIDPAYWSPGWFDFDFSSPPSNTVTSGMLGDANLLGISSTGESFALEPSTGVVSKFKPDMSSDGQFPNPAFGYALAVDPTNNQITIVDGVGGIIATYDENGNPLGGGGNNNEPAVSAAALNDLSCGLLLNNDTLYCTGSQNFQSVVTASTHHDPTKVWMVSSGGQTIAYVFSRPDDSLQAFTVTPTSVTAGASVTVNGIGHGTTGFQLAFTDATTAIVLDQAGGTLVSMDAVSGVQHWTAAISESPFRLALDPANNTIYVAQSNNVTRETQYVSVNAATGAATNLTSTSTLLSVGFGFNATTSNLASAMRGQGAAVPTN